MTLNPVKLLGPPFFPLSTGRRGPSGQSRPRVVLGVQVS